MPLTLAELTLKKEKRYYLVVLFLALLIWIFVAISIIGIFYAAAFAFMIWLTNGLFIANLKSDCVKINAQQLPELDQTYREVCRKLEVKTIPELYVAQSGGMLNAFATRHAGRDFVVIYSEILETYGQNSDEIRFLIGHEIGHIKSRHILKSILLGPGLFFPLIGPAYYRACEATCDRFGAFATQNINGAVKAMMVLSGGKQASETMNPETFSQQSIRERGFFVSWYELISGYPTQSKRVGSLLALRDGTAEPRYRRNPLSYLFALFSIGGPGAGGGQIFITIFILAMAAAIAIPNFLRAKVNANDTLAKTNVLSISSAYEMYKARYGQYPKSSQELFKTQMLRKDYCGHTLGGFTYECISDSQTYHIIATPVKEGSTGSQTFYFPLDFEREDQ